MFNRKSQIGKGLTAGALAFSMTIAGVGMFIDAGPALAGKKKSKKQSSRQHASARNSNRANQNAEANGGRCVNVSPSIGGVAIAPAVNVLGFPLIQIPIAVVGPPTNTGNQSCDGGQATNTNSADNNSAVAVNQGPTQVQ